MSYLGNEPPQLAGYSAQTKAAPVGSSITLNQEGTINSTLLFLDGVRQTPTTDYTISGTTLTLTSTAPTTAVATILFLGDVADIGVPSDDTVNVDQLDTTSTGSTGQFLRKTGAATIDWADAATDTSGIEDDIALLGFKVAANGSLAKYNLVDQTIDVFEDATGIDTSASTGEYLNTSKYYSNKLLSEVTVTSGLLSQSGLGGWSAANLVDDNIATHGFYTDSSGAGSYVRIDFGSGNEKQLAQWRYYVGTVNAVWNLQYSSDAVSWTNMFVGFDVSGSIGWKIADFSSLVTAYRYWQSYKTDAAVGGGYHDELKVYSPSFTGTMSLVSNTTTAEDGAPTNGDLVITYTDANGTATVNTDLKAYISRDGSAYTSAVTLTDQGTSGGHKILTAHNVDLSGIATGTSMRWKIETLNQATTKETRIQAVSLGWS